MKTLPWFERKLSFGYPREMLPFFIERLSGTVIRLRQKVKDVDDAILSEKPENKWSIKQNIGHLAEVDGVANQRIDQILSGVTIMAPTVFEPTDYSTWPVEKVLLLLEQSRSNNLKKYASLSGTDLLKSSQHPRLKVQMTPVDLAWFDAEHDDHHLVKINEIIFTLTKK